MPLVRGLGGSALFVRGVAKQRTVDGVKINSIIFGIMRLSRGSIRILLGDECMNRFDLIQ